MRFVTIRVEQADSIEFNLVSLCIELGQMCRHFHLEPFFQVLLECTHYLVASYLTLKLGRVD